MTDPWERAGTAPNKAGDAVLLILGPLRLRGPGGEVRLGGTRPRRLLATLALHAGQSVPADRLVDAVWGEAPPRTAAQNLHTYLWSLRRSIAAVAGGLLAILASPAGYRLEAGPGALDWHRFQELAAAGHSCLPSDPVGAAWLLSGALELWRDSPVADVADLLPQEAARIAAMEETRLTVLEQRIEADLGAGRGRELVPELAELTAAHPFREQLRAHQMVALYRCGRRGDAVMAFHQLRAELASQLGIDPSPRLAALFQAMLRAGPGLDPVTWPPGQWRVSQGPPLNGSKSCPLALPAPPGSTSVSSLAGATWQSNSRQRPHGGTTCSTP